MATKREGMDMWMQLERGLTIRLMDGFVDTIEDCPEGTTVGEHLANVLEREARRLRNKE